MRIEDHAGYGRAGAGRASPSTSGQSINSRMRLPVVPSMLHPVTMNCSMAWISSRNMNHNHSHNNNNNNNNEPCKMPQEMYNRNSNSNSNSNLEHKPYNYYTPSCMSLNSSLPKQPKAEKRGMIETTSNDPHYHYSRGSTGLQQQQRPHTNTTFSAPTQNLPTTSSPSRPRRRIVSRQQQQQQQYKQHRQHHQQLTNTPPPPPPSFIYASSRANFAATPIVKSIRQEVRSMTRGTRLLPITTTVNSSMSNDHDYHHDHHHSVIQLLNSPIDTLQTHYVLGTGSFSMVTSVTINSRVNTSCNTNSGDEASLNHRQYRTINGQRYYACKAIKQELISRGGQDFFLAASQLAYEAHVLSCLDHPNIVKIRGLDDKGFLGFERDDRGFFLLMDVLCETLQHRIDRWRKMDNSNNRNRNRNNKASTLLRRHLDKLGICLQLASALEYIHGKSIVYRDLKPANVGFASVPSPNHLEGEEIYNTLQLFDFGLCHEFTTDSATPLTGVIGTMRYMAPEVCLEEHYDYGCDIYSYAIVCWELWTHRIPFEPMTSPDMYREVVCRRGYRPYPDQSKEVNHSPQSCWNPRQQQHHQQQQQQHNNDNVDLSLVAVPMDRSISPLEDPLQTVPNRKNNKNNSPLPREISILLSQAWTHDPKSRICWSRIRNQLALFKTLVDLQLEAQDLSESATTTSIDDDNGHGNGNGNGDSNNGNDGYNYGGNNYMQDIFPDFVTSNDCCNNDRDSWRCY